MNQLASLKEKGKRLLYCDRLDIQFKQHCLDLEDRIHEEYEREELDEMEQYNLDMFAKSRIEEFKTKFYEFSVHGIKHQEENVEKTRTELIKQLDKLPDFNQRNHHINQKITYDQRFFNDGYHEFQLMISDVRKQARLNQEVVQLKKELTELCIQIDEKERFNRAFSQRYGIRYERSRTLLQKKHSLRQLQAQL